MMEVCPEVIRGLAAPSGPGTGAARLRQLRLNVPFFKRVICNQWIFIDKKYKSPILSPCVGSLPGGYAFRSIIP
jgi:hypothetical protein